jgi:hypothetical protein
VTTDCQLIILGLVVSLETQGRPTTVRLGDRNGEVLGVLDYHSPFDAYTSSVDNNHRPLLDQLELLVRSYQSRRRQQL